jgi:hypothetical protein
MSITARAAADRAENGSLSISTPAATDRTVVRLHREAMFAMGALVTA